MTLSGNYLHIRKDTGAIFYVGLGNLIRAKDMRNRSAAWKNIKSQTEIEFKYLGDRTKEDAATMEKSLIKIFGRLNNGTGILINQNDGGQGNPEPTEETRKKISEGNRKRYLRDGERERTSRSMTGRKCSDEMKAKMSAIAKKRHADAKAKGLGFRFVATNKEPS